MITEVADRASIEGPMTLPHATALLAEGAVLVARSTRVFDLGAVSEVDSTGLAVVFGWLREARRLGKTIQVANPSKELLSLAEVYGVRELLPLG